ncbi:MAG: MotA/TolQ/ExbB proton channel family protein [Candidatus Omnitrophica bacterium]|nr:MotA/TolQ/ExbB proton channel family protein [Candidatus Omnitrophota bacterium]
METLLTGYLDSSWAGRIIVLAIIAGSIISWAVILFKIRQFRRSEKEMEKFQQLFEHLGGNLDALYEQTNQSRNSPAGRLFQACYREIHHLAPRESNMAVIRTEVIEGVERASARSIAESEIILSRGLPVLTMTASISPLMGLLGTVWGILEVFQSMDQSTAPSIKDIAPGISAALVTTVFGLLAAMPAAGAYNIFLVRINRMLSILENLASMISNILVRHQLRQEMRSEGRREDSDDSPRTVPSPTRFSYKR